MAINNEIGIISRASQGKIRTNKYKNELILIPFSVIYLMNDIALVNQIKQVRTVTTIKK